MLPPLSQRVRRAQRRPHSHRWITSALPWLSAMGVHFNQRSAIAEWGLHLGPSMNLHSPYTQSPWQPPRITVSRAGAQSVS
jgi:hypothetical protein